MMNSESIAIGLRSRVVAFAYDYLPIVLILALFTALFALIGVLAPDFVTLLYGGRWSSQITSLFIVTIPVTLYFAVLESGTRKASWGKWKRGFQVVTTAGEPLSFGRALGRTVLKFVPWELSHTAVWDISYANGEVTTRAAFFLVLAGVLIVANVVSLWQSPLKQTLYDRLTKTVVRQQS